MNQQNATHGTAPRRDDDPATGYRSENMAVSALILAFTFAVMVFGVWLADVAMPAYAKAQIEAGGL